MLIFIVYVALPNAFATSALTSPVWLGAVCLLQESDASGAEVFTVLLPSGTPLPARRHHIVSGGGTLAPLRLEIYQRLVAEQPEKLAKVKALAFDHTSYKYT